MAVLVIENQKVEAKPVSKGLLEISLNGEIVGRVETIAKNAYRSIDSGREFGSQVEALKASLALFKAKSFLSA